MVEPIIFFRYIHIFFNVRFYNNILIVLSSVQIHHKQSQIASQQVIKIEGQFQKEMA